MRRNSQDGEAQVVGAAAQAGADDGAARAPVLGAVVVRGHLELAHRVGRELHHLVGEALVAGAIGVVLGAVEHEVVEGTAQAVYVIGSVAPGERAFESLCGAGRQQREVGVGAAVERQIHRLLPADDGSPRAAVGFQQRRRFGDRDALGDFADFQLQVDPLARGDGDRERIRYGLLEARVFGRHLAAADLHVEELVVAGGVGDRAGGDACIDALQRYRAIGNSRFTGVANGAEHGGGLELCERRPDRKSRQSCGPKRSDSEQADLLVERVAQRRGAGGNQQKDKPSPQSYSLDDSRPS